VTYRRDRATFGASFAGGCIIDGATMQSQFARHQSPYAQIARDPKAMRIAFAKHSLVIDFAKQQRIAK
jgi:hypothetical protein